MNSASSSAVLEAAGTPLGAPTEHELRTALAMIVGYAELLRTRDDPAIHAEAPERILAAAERLSATIDRLGAAGPARLEEVRSPASVSALAPPRAQAGESDFRIAVASDDPGFVRQLETALPRESFDVVRAHGAADVRELAVRAQPDLVVVDWSSVGDGASELVRELKLEAPRTPVLAVLPEGHAAAAPSIMADAVLVRPVTDLHLLAKVYELASPPTARAAAG